MNLLTFWMTMTGTICWAVCFCWMHRISANQNRLLDELKQQNQRIEKLSKAEHDLIKAVLPQVGEIAESVEEMKQQVKKNGG